MLWYDNPLNITHSHVNMMTWLFTKYESFKIDALKNSFLRKPLLMYMEPCFLTLYAQIIWDEILTELAWGAAWECGPSEALQVNIKYQNAWTQLVWNSSFPSVAPRPATSALSGNIFALRLQRPHPWSTESETLDNRQALRPTLMNANVREVQMQMDALFRRTELVKSPYQISPVRLEDQKVGGIRPSSQSSNISQNWDQGPQKELRLFTWLLWVELCPSLPIPYQRQVEVLPRYLWT